ncbi:MAG: hypothetical protein WKG01_31950 [Kofleriaceae bacterium]
MPTTTGISAIPHGRPGGEVQLATVPVFRLSSAASGDDRNGQSTPQLSALIDPDRWAIRGLILGGRLFGESGDTGLEPYVGYRRRVGGASFAVVAFGTKMGAEKDGVTYDATRVGGEVMGDALLGTLGTWGQLHAGGSVAMTYLSANGTYCVADTGNGRDCGDDPAQVPRVDAELSGVYTAGTLLFALDIARRSTGVLHGVRVGAMFSAGHMPRLIDGRQQRGDVFISGGLGLTVGFGSSE